MGDTVNLAARVMSKATPGQVLVTPDVLERSQLTFETEALEPFSVKGKRQARSPRSRSGRRAGTPAAVRRSLPLVGRDRRARGARARSRGGGRGRVALRRDRRRRGHGQVAARRGAARAARRDATRCITIRCEAYESAAPYAPFWVLLRYLLGVDARRAPRRRRSACCASRSPTSRPSSLTSLLAARDAARSRHRRHARDRDARAGVPPATRRRGDRRVPAADRLPRPAVLVFEDVHHMDEPSVGLLHRLIALAPPSLLLCVTRRPAETRLRRRRRRSARPRSSSHRSRSSKRPRR